MLGRAGWKTLTLRYGHDDDSEAISLPSQHPGPVHCFLATFLLLTPCHSLMDDLSRRLSWTYVTFSRDNSSKLIMINKPFALFTYHRTQNSALFSINERDFDPLNLWIPVRRWFRVFKTQNGRSIPTRRFPWESRTKTTRCLERPPETRRCWSDCELSISLSRDGQGRAYALANCFIF